MIVIKDKMLFNISIDEIKFIGFANEYNLSLESVFRHRIDNFILKYSKELSELKEQDKNLNDGLKTILTRTMY